jgi:8-oxo-dGTP pyrophosphatase MutT (NUDIX family)
VKFLESVPHYLLVRRRDSISYVEFLRGKYKMDNPDYISLLINGMSGEERRRLLTGDFHTLWETLWNSQNTRQFRNEYEIAHRAFEAIRNTGDIHGRLLVEYVERATDTWSEPEWGFPKGRRTLREAERRCALREFSEETGLTESVVHLVEDEPVYIEEYTGTNGIAYKQVYYVGAVSSDNTVHLEPTNRVMSREIGDIRWLPFEDAYLKIRPTSPVKRALLGRLHYSVVSGGLGERLQGALEWTTR